MYSKTPNVKNTTGKIICFCSTVAGVALFALGSMKHIPFPWLAQLIGAVFFTLGIYIMSAFLLREYVFCVKESNRHSEDAAPDFVVYQKHGVQMAAVCRFGFDEIDEIREVTPENKKAVFDGRKKLQRYTYNTQFCARYFIEICSDGISVLITYDEEILAVLKKYYGQYKK